MSLPLLAGVGLLGLAVLLLAVVGALHLFRGRAIRRFATFGEPIAGVAEPEFLLEIELLARCRLMRGNRYELLSDGAAIFPRLWEDLRSATTSITIQQYFAERGKVFETLLEILEDRARAGVSVLVLIDSIGLKGRFSRQIRELEAAGVQARVYRPTRLSMFGRADSRLHSRGIVIDGRIGYTGGFGFSDKWYGGHGEPEWRDTAIRFTGPAVLQLQAAFAGVWAEPTGHLISGERFFPLDVVESAPGGGNGLAAVVDASAGLGSSVGERLIVRSFAAARQRLYITNSYFVPDDDMARLLGVLASSGVDVRIITAGAQTDLPIVRWAGRSKYERLLSQGVRIYEYAPAMMHAKTFVVDGLWSSVGAMNLDVRSMILNEEATFVAFDPELGARLEAMFAEDVRHSREIELEEFSRRGVGARLLERASAMWTEVL